jgi:hypothetical protein
MRFRGDNIGLVQKLCRLLLPFLGSRNNGVWDGEKDDLDQFSPDSLEGRGVSNCTAPSLSSAQLTSSELAV